MPGLAELIVRLTGGSDLPSTADFELWRNRLTPEMRAAFGEAGASYNLSPFLLLAIAARESSLNPNARNTVSGAAGLMQIIPANFARYGLTTGTAYNVRLNVLAGAADLDEKLNEQGDLDRALAAYSGHVTWLRTGGAPEPWAYIDRVYSSAIVFQLTVKL